MAPKEIDEVEERIVGLQSALDDLQNTLGRLHESIDLIEPPDDQAADAHPVDGPGARIDLDASTREPADVIDLRGVE